MKFAAILLIILCLFISVHGYSQILKGKKYQRMTSDDKMDKIRMLLRH